jgi:hypothetical protein
MGVEFFLKYDAGRPVSLWASDALARAEDHITDIEYDGFLTEGTGWVPRLGAQNHTVNLDVNVRPTERWLLNAAWVYYVGWPRTDYTYRYQALDSGELHFYAVHGTYNAESYPAYHRLDLRASHTFPPATTPTNTPSVLTESTSPSRTTGTGWPSRRSSA